MAADGTPRPGGSVLPGASPSNDTAPAPLPLGQFFSHARAEPRPPERFVDEQLLDPARLDAVLRSLSLVGPALGPAALARLLAEARALAEAHGGARWRRVITLHHAVRRRG